MKNIALITGASSGMGRDFVYAVDREYKPDELWVVARRENRLLELSKDCKATVVPLALDFSDDESINKLADKLAAEDVHIRCLVNAAGFGVFGTFEQMDIKEQMTIVDVNAKSLIGVTYTALKYMHEGDDIINLGSNGSWQPVPYENVYASSKAFVLNFSRALGKELEKRKIHVICVCPDWVRTEFIDNAVRDDTITYFDHWYESKDVVEKAMKDLKKGKTVSILGFPVRFQVFLVKLLPCSFIMNTWCKQQKK